MDTNEKDPGVADIKPPSELQAANKSSDLLRKFFWAGMIGLALVALVGLVMLLTGTAKDSPWFGVLARIDTEVRANHREGATSLFIVMVLIVGFALMMATAGDSGKGLRSVLPPLLVGMLFIGLGGYLLPANTIWGWALAAIPALMVVHHALYVGKIKPRFIHKDMSPKRNPKLSALIKDQEDYFEPRTLSLRYGLPALVIFAVGAVVFHVLNPVTEWALNVTLHPEGLPVLISETTLLAARFGAVGAYIYVMLYLGERGFQHDLSSGSVLWCAITLALGPLMAAVFSKVWVVATGGATPVGWGTQALYLAVGMTPRYTAQQIAALSQRLSTQASRAAALERAMPLSMIRGITPRVEERLIEEGIDDVATMAMANPLRIQRSTNFDKRQILSWIDAALLMHALPEDWSELEKQGIRGAMDLVRTSPKAGAEVLGASVKLDMVQQVAQRLRDDAQVQLIQMVYELIDTEDPPLKLHEPKGMAEVTAGLQNAAGAPAVPAVPEVPLVAPPLNQNPPSIQPPS